MKLFYRPLGSPNSAFEIDLSNEDTTGRYRGQTYRVNNRYPRHLSGPQTVTRFKYRGIDYGVYRQIPCDNPNGSSLDATDLASETAIEVGQTHCHNLLLNLEHRLQVAKANNDRVLIDCLERERQEIFQSCSL
ncbi:DUF4278 domain-containing protein [Roseofilum casamattae]|uniref:DUF4278 domain-containing protein n=1 Tax=Roseofilum casamattae BLCC-M143 TaxID=3022442 RepID=A0ABT7C2A6_9CYAN|nr:DUF4278 domain-containing protein [Roseofilum casamattae]MDJ1185197.1 DUF4278 domain-containing protein [Roseofilum casamattae BLCC-M143]